MRLLVGVNVVKIERVLFLQPQPCIRALKYAHGLKQTLDGTISIVFGHLYHTLNVLYGYGDETFDKLVKLRTDNLESDIRRLVESHRPQVIHSHNAPDLLTVSAIEAVGNVVPIIHDSHEALSLRRTGYYATDDCMKMLEEYPKQEKTANEGSDARIYVTEYVKTHIQQMYDVDREKDIVFPNYVSESVVPQRFMQKLSVTDGQTHVVYVGAVTSRIEGCYYDLREIFEEIANRKVHVHLYVSLFGLEDKAYVKLAQENRLIHYHGHVDQRILLQEITQYDYGWAGFNANERNEGHVDSALPNKIFEYLASGLPILAFPHKTIKGFVEEHEVGLVFNDLDDMVNQLKNRETSTRLRENAIAARHGFTVERNINKVADLYRNVSTL